MRKADLKNEKTVANMETSVAFHITRGGQFFNPGFLKFCGIGKKILDFQENCHEDENDCLIGEGGNIFMDKNELESAKKTGIGKLNFDEAYDTVYVKQLSELNLKECDAIAASEDVDAAYIIGCLIENEIFDLNEFHFIEDENDDEDEDKNEGENQKFKNLSGNSLTIFEKFTIIADKYFRHGAGEHTACTTEEDDRIYLLPDGEDISEYANWHIPGED